MMKEVNINGKNYKLNCSFDAIVLMDDKFGLNVFEADIFKDISPKKINALLRGLLSDNHKEDEIKNLLNSLKLKDLMSLVTDISEVLNDAFSA